MTNRGIRAVEFPSQISPNAAELIRLLCHPGTNLGQCVWFRSFFSDPERRLGAREGIEEVREVDLLRNFDFCKLRHGLIDSPIKVQSLFFCVINYFFSRIFPGLRILPSSTISPQIILARPMRRLAGTTTSKTEIITKKQQVTATQQQLLSTCTKKLSFMSQQR